MKMVCEYVCVCVVRMWQNFTYESQMLNLWFAFRIEIWIFDTLQNRILINKIVDIINNMSFDKSKYGFQVWKRNQCLLRFLREKYKYCSFHFNQYSSDSRVGQITALFSKRPVIMAKFDVEHESVNCFYVWWRLMPLKVQKFKMAAKMT